jgi:phosphohistidine swiveling domain-containing protein
VSADSDPLHCATSPELHWSRSNVGEAMPGVQTPLSWTVWSPGVNEALHEAAFAVGAFSRRERSTPVDRDSRPIRIFFGRVAMNVEFLTVLGDRIPGTTGAKAAESVFGSVPAEICCAPTSRRYPIVACRLPATFLSVPTRIRRFARETDAWYPGAIESIHSLDESEALSRFTDAHRRFIRATVLQCVGILGMIQPAYEALATVVERAGTGDIGTLCGAGGAEMAVVIDIWRAAHGEIPLSQAVKTHGFHGPLEGELSGRVWREDPEPLKRLLDVYAGRRDPRASGNDGPARQMRADVLAALPISQRGAARLILRIAPSRILARGVIKRSFLQCFDVARAIARHMGALLCDAGTLADADDIFYLTVEELMNLPANASDVVVLRRAQRSGHQQVELPAVWRGRPTPIAFESLAESLTDSGVIQGAGVSGGIAEGRARVVSDPGFEDVEEGEILIAAATDPSWSSIMYVSAALVVDIGGALSHAAVVAREMHIPCVVATQDGSRRVHTGDYVRVDGGTGEVIILKRATGEAGV